MGKDDICGSRSPGSCLRMNTHSEIPEGMNAIFERQRERSGPGKRSVSPMSAPHFYQSGLSSGGDRGMDLGTDEYTSVTPSGQVSQVAGVHPTELRKKEESPAGMGPG